MEKDFGLFFKEKRQEKNLTQKELSKLLFVSESAVSKWEKNIAHPDITLLPKIAEILGVTEHELITASIDDNSRQEKVQAKKWRTLSFTWSMFFYVAYSVALIPCFICNLAIDKTLSWFWIVLSALVLSFTFTNLPKLVKKHKLLILPASMYLALCLLLGVCTIYTKGNWFLIAAFSVLFAMIIVFMPIYISKYKVFEKIRKYNDFVSIFIDFVTLNILLVIIDVYSVINGYSAVHWYFKLALPIAASIYLFLNILLCVRFLKINRFLKTGIILTIINFVVYGLSYVIKTDNAAVQYEIESFQVFKANFSKWSTGMQIERNIHLIIFLTMLALAVVFFVVGAIKHIKSKNKNSPK